MITVAPVKRCIGANTVSERQPRLRYNVQTPNLSAARAFALAASSSRFFGGAVVSRERRRRIETLATSPTAIRNASSFPFDGLLKPVIFLTNCREAARISSSVTGGSKLKRVLIFRHMFLTSGLSYQLSAVSSQLLAQPGRVRELGLAFIL